MTDPGGRHTSRADSVSVAQLVARQQAGETAARLWSRRTIAVATAVVVSGLLATTVSALATAPAQRPEPVAAIGPARIDGTEALRPDRVLAALDRSGQPPPLAGARVGGQQRAEGDSGPLEPVPEPVVDPAVRAATDFYRAVDTTPTDAFDLLDERMRGSGYPDFESSWAGIVLVSIGGVRKVAPDTVLMAVRMERGQGTMLRTLQRVAVDENGRITDASLLAATMGGQG